MTAGIPPFEQVVAHLPLVVAREQVGPSNIVLEQLSAFEPAVAAVERLLRGRVRERSTLTDLSPMFGVLWPAARTLAGWALEHTDPDSKTVELGCGLALPSIVAASRGAAVLATDMHPWTAALLRRNCSRNRVQVSYEALDWRSTPTTVAQRYDRVLASDVLYAWDLAPLLLDTVESLLAPEGVACITDPGRAWLEDMLALAEQRFDVVADVAGPDGGAFFIELRHR